MEHKRNSIKTAFIPRDWLDGSFDPGNIQLGSKFDQADTPKRRSPTKRRQQKDNEKSEKSFQEVNPNLLPFYSRLNPHDRRTRRMREDKHRNQPETQSVDTSPKLQNQFGKTKSEAVSSSDKERRDNYHIFESVTQEFLDENLNFDPIDKLGQNFLVNPKIIEMFVNSTILGAQVVEVGAGPGNMTVGIASRATRVVGLEIYSGYREIQNEILRGVSNVEIITGDALRFDFTRWADRFRRTEVPLQIMGNIPFHISEPLFGILARISGRLDRVSLIVGENLKNIIEVNDNPRHELYSKLSFLTSVFEVEKVVDIDNSSFWPEPPVNAGLIILAPREIDPNGKVVGLAIRKAIIKNPELGIGKIIESYAKRKTSDKDLDRTAERRFDRRQTKRELQQMVREKIPILGNGEVGMDQPKSNLLRKIPLSREMLNTPFQRLSTQQVKELAIILGNL